MLLYSLHVAAFFIHLVSFILSLFCHINQARSDILIPKHVYEVDKRTVTGSESIASFHAISWISLNEALTCFSHGIALYLLQSKRAPSEVNDLEHGRRTVEYAFTAGILACALVLSTGSVFLQDLIFLLGTNVALQGVGHLIHKHSHKSMLMYAVGFLLLALEIIYVAIQTTNNHFPDSFDSTFFVVMGVIFGLLYLCFGLVKVFVDDKDLQDELYVALSVTTKVVLSWIVISNTHQGFIDLFETMPTDVIDIDWRAVQIVLTTVLLVMAVVLSYYILTREKSPPLQAVALYVGAAKVQREDLYKQRTY